MAHVTSKFVSGSLALSVVLGWPPLMSSVEAQAPAPAQPPAAQAPSPFPKVALTAGRSTVVTTDFDITRMAVTNPTIADATVVRPREILVDGKAPGTISLIVWGAGDTRTQYDVVVEQPI